MIELKNLLSKLTQNLNILREREAKFGGYVPLDLLNQIEDYEKAIALVKELAEQLKPLNLNLDRSMTEPVSLNDTHLSVDSDNIALDNLRDITGAAIGRQSQAAQAISVGGSIIQSHGNVILSGESLRDKQYRDALKWDGKTLLREYDLAKRNLQSVYLKSADLRQADLSNANLENADLSNANLNRCNLNKANLNKATMSRANLTEANLTEAHLIEANLQKAILNKANLTGANLERSVFQEEISGSSYDNNAPLGADLRETNFFKANLKKADLRDANLQKANLKYADLSDADLSHAPTREEENRRLDYERQVRLSLMSSYGKHSDDFFDPLICLQPSLTKKSPPRGANLVGANLQGANLRGANLRGADLSGANLKMAKLEGADLDGVKLDEAKYDSKTKWPEGFQPDGTIFTE